jgi:3-methyladenine DNA glycosylase AlkD
VTGFEPDEVVGRLERELRAVADPERAASMAAYMKGHFPYFGVPTPERRLAQRAALAGVDRPTQAALVAFAAAMWELPEREYQYFACDLLVREVKRCDGSLLPVVERLVVTKSWWDTVDVLATRVTGPLVAADRSLQAVMDEWVASPNLWLARTAILHQLHFGADTDVERLFAYCLARAADSDFFIRKAIGWALRHYARTDPDAVRAFVAAHDRELSGLSQREATKHL